jgi:hypothetical protein
MFTGGEMTGVSNHTVAGKFANANAFRRLASG